MDRFPDRLVQGGSVPCVESGDYRDIPGVDTASWRIDLAFSVFYGKIFPLRFIERADRFLNLHNAPLPAYRGVAPINWALENGEFTHGVTIHEVVPDIDAGPIVSQVVFSIYPDVDEVIDVYRRALSYGYVLFEQTMPILARISARSGKRRGHLLHPRGSAAARRTTRFYARDITPRAGTRLIHPQVCFPTLLKRGKSASRRFPIKHSSISDTRRFMSAATRSL